MPALPQVNRAKLLQPTLPALDTHCHCHTQVWKLIQAGQTCSRHDNCCHDKSDKTSDQTVQSNDYGVISQSCPNAGKRQGLISHNERNLAKRIQATLTAGQALAFML